MRRRWPSTSGRPRRGRPSDFNIRPRCAARCNGARHESPLVMPSIATSPLSLGGHGAGAECTPTSPRAFIEGITFQPNPRQPAQSCRAVIRRCDLEVVTLTQNLAGFFWFSGPAELPDHIRGRLLESITRSDPRGSTFRQPWSPFKRGIREHDEPFASFQPCRRRAGGRVRRTPRWPRGIVDSRLLA